MTVTLRPYQRELVDGVAGAWAAGQRNALAVMATGGGKSVCLSHVVSEEQGLSCVMAHRQELVSQLSGHLAKWGVPHRLIAPTTVVRRVAQEHRREHGRSWVDQNARASVASVDTLVAPKRAPLLKSWAAQVGLWVIDEAAHVLRENKWGRAASMFHNARGLGVTATPERADGKGLGRHASGLFDQMILGPDTRALIRSGSLSDYEIVVPASDMDLSAVNVTASGDFSPKGLRTVAHKSHIVGDVVENYRRFANGTQAVVFATDVETAGAIAADFNANGIPAAAVSGETPDGERAAAVATFRDGTMRVLVNVDLFDEGFDLPAIETVIMARPTYSLSKYLQMIGRGLRPMPGKERALVIDHVSNVKRLGLPCAPRIWSLNDRDKRSKRLADDTIPVTHCEMCLHAYERIHRACPHCGHEREPSGRSLPEQVDGDLMLLDRDALERLRAATVLETPESVAERAEFVAGTVAAGRGAAARQRERIEAQGTLRDVIAQWAGYRRADGMDDPAIHRLFYHRFGTSVLEALALKRADMDRLRERIEG